MSSWSAAASPAATWHGLGKAGATIVEVARVRTETGVIDLTFDEVVIALGARTRIRALPGVREHALPFKDLADAIALRNHVLHQLELADADLDGAERRLTFTFVGAGYAGVEALAEAHDLVRDSLRHYRACATCRSAGCSSTAATASWRRPPSASARTRPATSRAAGSRSGSGPGSRPSTPPARRSPTARASTPPRWAFPRPAASRRPSRGRGRPTGGPSSRTIGFDSTPAAHTSVYRYRTLGQVASLGRHRGIAQLPGIRLRGFDGWVVARAYHLLQLPSLTRRSRVLADWTTSGIFRRDIAELTALNAVGATEVHRA